MRIQCLIFLSILFVFNTGYSQDRIVLDHQKYSLNVDAFDQGMGIMKIMENNEDGTRKEIKLPKGSYILKSDNEQLEFDINENGQLYGTGDYVKKGKAFSHFIFKDGKVIEVNTTDNAGNPLIMITINDTLFLKKTFNTKTGKLDEQYEIRNGGGAEQSINTTYYENGNINTDRNKITKSYTQNYQDGTTEFFENLETGETIYYDELGNKTSHHYRSEDNGFCEDIYESKDVITQKKCRSPDRKIETNYYYENEKLTRYEILDHNIGEMKTYDKNKKLISTEKIGYIQMAPSAN